MSSGGGLRLLDACLQDVSYARFLLTSKRAQDLDIRTKVNWKDLSSGNSILHFLVYSDMDEAVELLLCHGADPNNQNKLGETPLHWCARSNSTKSATRLLSRRANPNVQDIGGNSPLHYAILQSNIEMIILLLDYGANCSLCDNEGVNSLELTALSKASQTSQAIAVILLRHCRKHNIQVHPNIMKSLKMKKDVNPQLLDAEASFRDLQKAQEQQNLTLTNLLQEALARNATKSSTINNTNININPKEDLLSVEVENPAVECAPQAEQQSSYEEEDAFEKEIFEQQPPEMEGIEKEIEKPERPAISEENTKQAVEEDVPSEIAVPTLVKMHPSTATLLTDLTMLTLTTGTNQSYHQASSPHRSMAMSPSKASPGKKKSNSSAPSPKPITMYDAMRNGQLQIPPSQQQRQQLYIAGSPSKTSKIAKSSPNQQFHKSYHAPHGPNSLAGIPELQSPAHSPAHRNYNNNNYMNDDHHVDGGTDSNTNAMRPLSPQQSSKSRNPSIIQEHPFVVSMRNGNSGRVVPTRRSSAVTSTHGGTSSLRNSFSEDMDSSVHVEVNFPPALLLHSLPTPQQSAPGTPTRTQHKHMGIRRATSVGASGTGGNAGGGLRALAIHQASHTTSTKPRSASVTTPSHAEQQQQFLLAMMTPPQNSNSEDVTLSGEQTEDYPSARTSRNGQHNHHFHIAPTNSVSNIHFSNNANTNNNNNANNNFKDFNNSALANSGPAGQKMLIQQLLASLPQIEPLDVPHTNSSQNKQPSQTTNTPDTEELLPYFSAGMVQQHHLLATQVQSLQQTLQQQLQLIQQYQQPGNNANNAATNNPPKIRIPNIPSSLKSQHLQYQLTRRLLQDSAKKAASSSVTQVFPPAPYIPFLPDFAGHLAVDELGEYSPDHLDVFIAVEHCFDCESHNNQSLRHDTKTYVKHANNVLAALIRAIADAKLAVRVFALRCAPLTLKRLGACEVTVSLRVNVPAAPQQAPTFVLRNANTTAATSSSANASKMNGLASSSGQVGFNNNNAAAGGTTTPTGGNSKNMHFFANNNNNNNNNNNMNNNNNEEDDEEQLFLRRWISTCLHSKLQTKSWPNVSQLEKQVVQFLEENIKEVVTARNLHNMSDTNNTSTHYNNAKDSKDKDRQNKDKDKPIPPALEFHHAQWTSLLQDTLTSQYQQWIKRMKVPPVVERHHLDIDWPALRLNTSNNNNNNNNENNNSGMSGARMLERFLTVNTNPDEEHDDPIQAQLSDDFRNRRHPAGPMLDFALANVWPQGVFERAVCEHFCVFDVRKHIMQQKEHSLHY